MKKNRIKIAAGILSAALMVSVGGGMSSIAENGGKGVVVEAATKSSYKSESELRKIVLKNYPGTVVRVKKDWDDGVLEYEYRIRQSNGVVVEVTISGYGYIIDADYEGQYKNGIYYDWD